jgi:hypothetical protein
MDQKEKTIVQYLRGVRHVEPEHPYRGTEKRSGPRYTCDGKVEIFEEHSQLKIWSSFSNISLHGCMVESDASYPVGTTLRLKLVASGLDIEATGEVRVSNAGQGMGISLTSMSDEARSSLTQFLRTLAKSSSQSRNPGSVGAASSG